MTRGPGATTLGAMERMGVSGATRGHLRTKDWTRVSRGLYRPSVSDAPVQDELAAWAMVLPPSGAFTHLTAAREYAWWLPPVPADLPVFTCMSTTAPRPRRDGLRVAQHPHPVSVVFRHGLPIAAPAETLIACARDLRLLDLVVLIDAALHARSCSHQDIADLSSRHRRGAPLLRKALRLADGRSESAWETVLRMFHHACGVPVEPQFEVYDDAGRFVARGDLRILGTRTLHEYDGGEHRNRSRQRRDLRRERGLGNVGWLRRGYTSQEVLGQAHVILREADASMAREHRPERLLPWRRLLADSLFSPQGMARFRARLRLDALGKAGKVVTNGSEPRSKR